MDIWALVNNARVDWGSAAMKFEGLERDFRAAANVDLNSALSALVSKWKTYVKSTTWINPVPASDGSLIAYIRSRSDGNTLTVGWIAYVGSPEAALRRLWLRIYGRDGHGFIGMVEDELTRRL